jgi:hypothetical protein
VRGVIEGQEDSGDVMRQGDPFRRALAVAVLSLAACVDAPNSTGPTSPDDPLAQTFDALAQQSATSGDLARSDGFSHAAISVRSGVTPTRIEVRNGSVNEAFDAFATSVDWDLSVPAPVRPPARRYTVAWRRAVDGTLRVLTVSTPRDSAPVVSPLSLVGTTSPGAVFSGASAMYHEGIALTQGLPDLSETWYGTAGWVKVRTISSAGACPPRTDRTGELKGVTCEVGRFALRFVATFQRITIRGGIASPANPPVPPRTLSVAADHQMNGLALKFACVAPSSETGCP